MSNLGQLSFTSDTSDAKGYTLRDVPMIINKSQFDKSFFMHHYIINTKVIAICDD
jgi:hypothetical protein